MKHTGACKSLHKRSYLTIIMVHARTMLLNQNNIRNTEANNHHNLNIELSFHKYETIFDKILKIFTIVL